MAGFVARGEIPGLVTLVAHGDEVLVDAVGTTTAGGSEPMRRDTIFRIASLTKPIAAAATMLLVDDGVLRLDDAVERWLPALANRLKNGSASVSRSRIKYKNGWSAWKTFGGTQSNRPVCAIIGTVMISPTRGCVASDGNGFSQVPLK